MGIRRDELTEFSGAKGWKNRNFGKDGDGKTVLQNTIEGFKKPIVPDEDDPAFGIFISLMLATVVTGGYTAITADFTNIDGVQYDSAISSAAFNEGGVKAYSKSGARYLLQKDVEGKIILYKDESPSDRDDRYELVDDPKKANEIAFGMKEVFGDIVHALDNNLRDFPESMPSSLTYEGISPLYNDDGTLYRIADNADQFEDGYTLTAKQAQEAYTEWKDLATQLAGDGHIGSSDLAASATDKKDPLPYEFIHFLMNIGILYGGLGALNATRRGIKGSLDSKRRFKKQLSPKR